MSIYLKWGRRYIQVICDVIAGAWGKKFFNTVSHKPTRAPIQFNSIQSVPVSFGLWDTALKFLSPGPRSDVTDHLDGDAVVVLGCVQ